MAAMRRCTRLKVQKMSETKPRSLNNVNLFFFLMEARCHYQSQFIVIGRQEMSKLETGHRPWKHKVKSRPRLLLL